jgi:molybdopterin-guanine dinucleotide biosynthesis protein
VRERALIHVAGPKGAGKTTFIERVLGSAGEWILAARCTRDDSLRQARETAPKAHHEIGRYHDAGATGAAVFAFPENDIGSDAFFVTRLMEDYSQAVLLEGDNPLGFVDLTGRASPARAADAIVMNGGA